MHTQTSPIYTQNGWEATTEKAQVVVSFLAEICFLTMGSRCPLKSATLLDVCADVKRVIKSASYSRLPFQWLELNTDTLTVNQQPW